MSNIQENEFDETETLRGQINETYPNDSPTEMTVTQLIQDSLMLEDLVESQQDSLSAIELEGPTSNFTFTQVGNGEAQGIAIFRKERETQHQFEENLKEKHLLGKITVSDRDVGNIIVNSMMKDWNVEPEDESVNSYTFCKAFVDNLKKKSHKLSHLKEIRLHQPKGKDNSPGILVLRNQKNLAITGKEDRRSVGSDDNGQLSDEQQSVCSEDFNRDHKSVTKKDKAKAESFKQKQSKTIEIQNGKQTKHVEESIERDNRRNSNEAEDRTETKTLKQHEEYDQNSGSDRETKAIIRNLNQMFPNMNYDRIYQIYEHHARNEESTVEYILNCY